MTMLNTPTLNGQPARARILLTAHTLFYREGIRATGIDRIIAESGVAKVTFYRHFPSKNDLICAYLKYRHEHWVSWFTRALRRHDSENRGIEALVPALREWFCDTTYRGCAFINGVSELGSVLPEVMDITRQHKHAMTIIIENLLPPLPERSRNARLLAITIDGAIVHAQFNKTPEAALESLDCLVNLLRAGR